VSQEDTLSGGWDARSFLSSSSSHLLSSSESHRASLGQSGSRNSTAIPHSTDGRPSSIKTHRQPSRPSQLTVRSSPDMGESIMLATAMALMKRPTARLLSSSRNQWVR